MNRDILCELIKHRMAEFIHFPEAGYILPSTHKWIWLDGSAHAYTSALKPKNGKAKDGDTPFHIKKIKFENYHSNSIVNATDFCFKIEEIKSYYPYHEILNLPPRCSDLFQALARRIGRKGFENWISITTLGRMYTHKNHPQMGDEGREIFYGRSEIAGLASQMWDEVGPYIQRTKGGFAPKFIIHVNDLFNAVGRNMSKKINTAAREKVNMVAPKVTDRSVQESLEKIISQKEREVATRTAKIERLIAERDTLLNETHRIEDDIKSLRKSIEILDARDGIK